MRLTGHEVMIIAIIAVALSLGAITRCYRHAHSPGNPLPMGVGEPQRLR